MTPRDKAEKMSPNDLFLCRVGWKTWSQLIN